MGGGRGEGRRHQMKAEVAAVWQDDWHEMGCKCERCRNLIAAIVARWPDGEYVFTDEEIENLAGG